MAMANQHIYGRVSERMLYFHLKDLRSLRAKVRYVDEEITNARINKMKRKELVKCLVEHELGKENVESYLKQCEEWDQMKAFVEFGVTPPKSNKK